MSRSTRNPNRYGTEMRARKRMESAQLNNSECVTRPMTAAERAWMDSLPKPHPKERVIGVGITVEKAMKRKGYTG